MTPARRLTLAVATMNTALRQRDQAIRDMRAEGASLRDIAEAAGMSHPGVMKILQRTEPKT
jgi:transposase-like protein